MIDSKTINIRTKRILLCVFLIMSAIFVKAQQYSTLYWMHGIPQFVYANPAHQTDAGIYIGTPGASSIYAGYGNTGFAPSDLLRINSAGDFYWDELNFLSSLNKTNLLNLDAHVDVLAFGFRLEEKNYFHFNFSEKVGVNFGLPKDFLLLVMEGNNYFVENTETGFADFSGYGLNAYHYSEIGIGYSRKLELLDVGLRLKLLFGHANANINVHDLRLVTDPETFAISLYNDISISNSLPVGVGEIEIIGDDENDNNNSNNGSDDFDFDPIDYLLNFNNFGLGLDLGLVYEYDEKITLALSIIDLGYIRWKSNAETNRFKGDLEYGGIDVGNLFALGGFVEPVDEDTDEDYDPFKETLEELQVEYSQDPYSIMLAPKIYLSARYSFSDMHSFSLLTRGLIFQSKLYTSYSVAYNIQPIKPIGFSLSYTLFKGSYTNFGFGTHLNLYPFQLYLIVDNFYPALRPHDTQFANVHLGINWVFGYRKTHTPARPIHSWGF